MSRAQIPNLNFTVPLEERVRAAQGLPAFIRRARRLEASMARLESDLAEFHRREMTRVAKGLRVVILDLRRSVQGKGSRRRLKGSLGDLELQVRRYNRKRAAFLRTLDLSDLNSQIDAFHRYYPIEREAWCRTRVRPGDLRRWKPLGRRDLEDRLPPLRSP